MAIEIVCCSIASWMATRSSSRILSNSSIHTTPPSANTIAPPSIMKLRYTTHSTNIRVYRTQHLGYITCFNGYWSLTFYDQTVTMQLKQVENVAIVTHCNLRLPNAASIVLHFNFDACAKFEVGQPVRCCFIAFLLLICYVMLGPYITLHYIRTI